MKNFVISLKDADSRRRHIINEFGEFINALKNGLLRFLIKV